MSTDRPIHRVESLNADQQRILKRAGINTFRELAETYQIAPRPDELLDAIKLTPGPERSAFVQSLTPFLAPVAKSDRRYAMGCLFRDRSQAKAAPDLIHDELRALSIPSEASLAGEGRASGVRHQEQRGTCVAMAATKVLEILYGRGVQFSPQYLYWRMKEHAGFPDYDGAFADHALNVLEDYGCCLESTFPYKSCVCEGSQKRCAPRRRPPIPCDPVQGADPGEQVHVAARAYRTARGFLSSKYTLHSRAEVDLKGEWVALLDQLAGNEVADNVLLAKAAISGASGVAPRPVVGSFMVFDSCQRGPTRRTGRFILPLPGEEESGGGHAMAVVGYWDDPKPLRDELDPDFWPGGGYLIVQNSWGESWGHESPDGPGLGRIPYAYAHNFLMEIAMPVLSGEEASLKFGGRRQAAAAAQPQAAPSFCQECGAALTPGGRFCGGCGVSTVPAPPQPAVAKLPPVPAAESPLEALKRKNAERMARIKGDIASRNDSLEERLGRRKPR